MAILPKFVCPLAAWPSKLSELAGLLLSAPTAYSGFAGESFIKVLRTLKKDIKSAALASYTLKTFISLSPNDTLMERAWTGLAVQERTFRFKFITAMVEEIIAGFSH
jgi:hypothetical protein